MVHSHHHLLPLIRLIQRENKYMNLVAPEDSGLSPLIVFMSSFLW